MKFHFLIISLIAIVGCNTNSSTEILDTEHFSSQVSNKLREWKLHNRVVVSVKDSIAIVDIHYEKNNSDTLNSFYLDKESNDMVITMLSHVFYDQLANFRGLLYELTFEDYPDRISVSFRKQELEKRHREFEEVPIFYDFVDHAFKKMRYMGVMEATQLMKYLEKNTNVFDHQGSFWNLLHDYSKACQTPQNHLYSVYLFIWFTGVVNDPAMKNSERYGPSLLYYLKSCGFGAELMSLSPGALMKRLNYDYGRNEK